VGLNSIAIFIDHLLIVREVSSSAAQGEFMTMGMKRQPLHIFAKLACILLGSIDE
jgi:hypothetical protein